MSSIDSKLKTVVGTRPEIIRLSRIICLLDQFCEHYLVHTGQNFDYELNQIFFNDLELKNPHVFLDCAKNSSGVANTIGNIITRVDNIFAEISPDALMVLGDTNSCLSVIPAKRRKIPIFHLEAGNRCFDMRVPEEINRRIVDHTADINITYSSIAREYLLREGLPPDQVIKVGSPMNEVLSYYSKKISESKILDKLNLINNKFFLVSVHREENIEELEVFSNFIKSLNFISDKFDYPIIISTHPRTKKRIEETNFEFKKNLIFIKPLGFTDYLKLQVSAKVVLSDSGTISEESSILNFPALNLRKVNERPEAMEEGAVMMVGMDIKSILLGIKVLETQKRYSNRSLNIVKDYKDKNISDKILRIIYSYTNYVNTFIWKKD